MNKLLKSAFTLIELLVVIAIIGILSGLIIVSMSGVTQKANLAKAQAFSNSLRNSLMLNIVAEWKFDELAVATDGTSIQDSWGGANNLTLDTYVTTVDTVTNKLKSGTDCISNSCVQLDGTDDYLYSGTNTTSLDFGDGTNDSPFTLSGWFKATDWTSKGIMGKYSSPNYQYLLWTTSGDKLYFYTYDNSANAFVGRYSSSIALTSQENQWAYLVATYDGSKSTLGFKIYLNGVRIDDHDYFSGTYVAMEALNTNFMVGKYDTGAYFSGLVDDIRVFDSVMPVSQIKEHYYAGLNKLLVSRQITSNGYQDNTLKSFQYSANK